MMKSMSLSKILRMSSIVVIALLLVGCIVLWFLNYQTLQTMTDVSGKTSNLQYNNMKHYQQQYQTTKLKLEETQTVLEFTTAELALVQELNEQLREDIQDLEKYKSYAKGKGKAIESLVNNFRKRNKELNDQLKMVREELEVFQADISDMNEGRSKIKLFKNQIKAVKRNMGVLKKEAYDLKVAIQKEKDRLESLYGNGGYMIKDAQNRSITTFDPNRVNIDVKFLNK